MLVSARLSARCSALPNSKVDQFNVFIVIKKNIVWLYIAMFNAYRFTGQQCLNELLLPLVEIGFADRLLNACIQRLAFNKRHCKKGGISIRENVMNTDDIRML